MLQSILQHFTQHAPKTTRKPQQRVKAPELADPDNVDSEIRPEMLRDAPEDDSESEVDLVNLVMSRFEDASKSRRIHEREWLLCTSFNRGNQWVEWRDATNRLESLVDPNDPYRSYVTANQTRAVTTKLKTRATMCKPDASVKPLTPLPQDVGAAGEARDVLAHYDQLFDRQHQTMGWVDSALDTSTSFLKIIWDPTKEALTSYWEDDPDGQATSPLSPPGKGESEYGQPPMGVGGGPVSVGTGGVTGPQSAGPPLPAGASPVPGNGGQNGPSLGTPPLQMPPAGAPGSPTGPPGMGVPLPKLHVKSAPIGDVDECVTPAFEMYPDPKARLWEECGWIIHCKLQTLTYIQDKFGDRGYRVRGEVTGQSPSSGYWEGRLDAITGETYRTATQVNSNSAYVYEMWEKPTPRYRKGRLIRVAGRVLLTSPDELDWPYDKRDTFPFVPLTFQNKFGTIWGLNAVHDLVPLQRHLNNILSRIVDRINTDKPTILVPKGSEVGIDEYQSRRNFQKVYYEPGMPPTYQAPPPINGDWFNAIAVIKGLIEDISGVHEVSNGSVPPGVTAGTAIELLQNSDNTQLAEFIGNIETACRQRADWELALVAQFYAEPRLVAISQENSLPAAAMNARSFQHLTSGGRCRVEVTPGSAMPKMPGMQQQQMLDVLKAGGFTPDMLPVMEIFWEMMGLERSDTMPQRLDYALQKISAYRQATQPNPAQMAAVQAQAAQQQAAQAAQTAAQLQQIKTQADMALENQKNQNRIQQIQAEAQANIANDDRQLQRDAMLQAQDKAVPNVTIAFKGDPAATVNLERQLGLG
jgi:hypothetical protein